MTEVLVSSQQALKTGTWGGSSDLSQVRQVEYFLKSLIYESALISLIYLLDRAQIHQETTGILSSISFLQRGLELPCEQCDAHDHKQPETCQCHSRDCRIIRVGKDLYDH